jgi:hypothetical protein
MTLPYGALQPAPATAADATATIPTAPLQPNTIGPDPTHPHWWGRLILGQGEFAPGTLKGTLADLFPPTMGARAGASFAKSQAEGSKLGMALAALPLLPGGGEVAKPIEGLVHDIAPPLKEELATLLAQQAQHEGVNPFVRATSAGERILPDENKSLYELFLKKFPPIPPKP